MSQDRIGGATNPETAQAPHTVDLSAPPGDKTVVTTPGAASAAEPQKAEPADARPTLSLEKFVQQIAASGVIAERELETLVAGMTPPPTTAEECARELIRLGRLTRFQAQVIAQGKGKALTLGNYVFLDKIGAGGMGQVYKARHRRMHRTVAIKTLPVAMMKDPKAIARFQREVQAAARLSHPNVVTAHDCDEHEGVHFLVMEYVAGTDLHSLVKQHGRLPVDQAVDCIRQAARGLEYAHAAGVLHRDIKPSNLLLDKEGKVKILDLGLARLEGSGSEGEAPLQESLTATGALMGTVAYMSPEQALDTRHADARSDIYSLGCTLWYLLTAQPLYAGDTVVKVILAHRERPIPSLAAERPDAPAVLETILGKMVAKQPEDRYASMTDLLADLDRMQSETEPPAEPEAREFLKFLEAQSGAPDRKGATGKETSSVGTSRLPSGFLDENLSVMHVPAPPRRRWTRTRLAAIAGGIAAIALVAAIIIRIRNKDGTVTEIKVPDGSKVEIADDADDGMPGAIDFDAERKAAEWVMSVRGRLELVAEDGTAVPVVGGKLPVVPFAISFIEIARNPDVKDEDLNRLTRCRRLNRLDLYETCVSGTGLTYLKPIHTLRWLSLGAQHTFGGQGVISDATLAPLSKLTQLNTLMVMNNSKLKDGSLVHIGSLSNLWHLELHGTNITDEGLGHLDGIKELSILKLSCNGITDRGLGKMVASHPGLDELWFQDFGVGTRTLGPLAKAHNLRRLAISGNQLTSQGATVLGQLPHLEEVWLHFPISDAAVTCCNEIPNLKVVAIYLSTDESGFTQDAYQALSRHPAIDRVHLQGSVGSPTDESLDHLAKMPMLKSLTLSFDEGSQKRRYTADGITEFRAARPDIHLTVDGQDYPAATPDRQAAEWVLSIGGTVTIRAPGQPQGEVTAVTDLPTGEFEVVVISIASPESGSKVTDDGLRHIRGLKGLMVLSLLHCTNITDAGIAQLDDLPSLEKVALDWAPVGDASASIIAGFSNLKTVSFLVTPAGDDALERLCRDLNHLEVLQIGDRTSDSGLRHLVNAKNVKFLGNLRSKHLTESGRKHLANAPWITHLNVVSAQDADIKTIAELEHIEVVDLNDCQATPTGLRYLSAMAKLNHLNLRGSSNIRDDHLPVVCKLRGLIVLALQSTSVSDRGMADVAKLPHLQYLYLFSTAVGDAAVADLRRIASLRVLYINETKFTAEGVARLRQALPACRIISDHGTFEPTGTK